MREIVTIQIGACGNQVAQSFWNVISHEHGISSSGVFRGNSDLQLERINVFFNEGVKNKYYARAVSLDTDKASGDTLSRSPIGKLISPANIISSYGTNGTGNCFAKGYYTEGVEILDTGMEIIRREAEKADCIQGFQIIHSIGGGTGSGFGALVMQKLVDEYPSNLTQTFSVISSPKVSAAVVEPYNCMLSFPHLLANTHLTFCVDNEALSDICTKNLGLQSPSNHHMNHIIAHTMSGVTTCLRFPGQLNTGLRKIYVNMCPFPNLHFLVPGFAPLTSPQQVPYQKISVPELVQQIFNSKNMLAAIDLREGKMLTVAAIFRGLMSTKQVDTLMTNSRNKNSSQFVNWIPNNIKTAICDIPPSGLKMSSTFIGNTTAVGQVFKRIDKSFKAMLKRRAFLHWYTGEGMEEIEFTDAHRNLEELLEDYKSQAKDVSGLKEGGSDCCVKTVQNETSSHEIVEEKKEIDQAKINDEKRKNKEYDDSSSETGSITEK